MVGLTDGVYFIENKGHDYTTRLDLREGQWKGGQVQVWEAAEEGSNGWRNQRWLVTRVPGQENRWHITNLFYGVQAGVYLEQFNTWKVVSASPTSAQESATQWALDDSMHDGSYRIAWAKQQTYMLDVDGNETHGKVFASMPSGEPSQLWMFIPDPTIATIWRPRSEWMKSVNDDHVKLSKLNLVGTHQSLALHGKGNQGHQGSNSDGSPFDNPRCQNSSPYEQIMNGVRSLDLRFTTYSPISFTIGPTNLSLFAWHGGLELGAEEGYSFLAVLQGVKLFLEQFPSETIIMKVVNETNVNGSLFEQAFRSDLSGFEYLFYNSQDASKQSMNQISLSEVRGKAVLLMTAREKWDKPWNHMKEIHDYDLFLRGNGITLFEESEYDTTDVGAKVSHCMKNLEKAAVDQDVNHVYYTSFNMSGFPVFQKNPSELAEAVRNTLSALDVGSSVARAIASGVAGGFAGVSVKMPLTTPDQRVGMVVFDFYEMFYNECLVVMRSNPGCANIP